MELFNLLELQNISLQKDIVFVYTGPDNDFAFLNREQPIQLFTNNWLSKRYENTNTTDDTIL